MHCNHYIVEILFLQTSMNVYLACARMESVSTHKDHSSVFVIEAMMSTRKEKLAKVCVIFIFLFI